MQIVLNGQDHKVDPSTNLTSLLSALSIALDGTAVAVNDEIVPKSKFNDFILEEGMRVDIFSLVAGG